MSAKVYWLKFGSGDPRSLTGMSPTFLQFFDSTGQTYAPPSIAEVQYGGVTATGAYGFSYTIGLSTANTIYFLAYSNTAISGVTNQPANFVSGVLDPILAIDQQLTAFSNSSMLGLTGIGQSLAAIGVSTAIGFTNIGQTLVAIGNTLNFANGAIGTTASSYGTTSQDPSSVFGYLKRIQELLEGDQVFTASTGLWAMYNRTSLGTTTLLRDKTLTNSGAQVTKTGL